MSDDLNSERTESNPARPTDDTSINPLETDSLNQPVDPIQSDHGGENEDTSANPAREDLATLPNRQHAYDLQPSTRPDLQTVPLLQVDTSQRSKDPMHLNVGELYGDFFVSSELGRGSFGVVYRAEQISLKRTVALKVTDTTRDDGCNAEGQTMAQLEHPSIVRVYLQSTDEVNQRRLLCMQYVSGINLRSLINRTRSRFGENWIGKHLLEILDQDAQEEIVLRETSLADRAVLEAADQLATVCWIGAESAQALDHAHRSGYIHRDVKPENTIINRFGRPMLVDFNLAMESHSDQWRGVSGGTIPYMSPESIRAFANRDLIKTDNAFAADLYALGVMLWELAGGEMPFPCDSATTFSGPEGIKQLIESRAIEPENDSISPRLADTLRRAIHEDPDQRFESAKAFAEALEGVMQQSEAIKSRSNNGRLGQSVIKRPVLWLFIAGFAPHVLASALQIAYNQSEIIGRLNSPSQYELFFLLVYWVNPVIYGICGFFVVKKIFTVLRPWLMMRRGQSVTEDQAETAREQSLTLPRYGAIVGGLGWLVGAIAFPSLLYLKSVRFPLDVWVHFVVSFVVSGAIAITFSYALLLAVVIYGIYPTMFKNPARFSDKATRELGPFRASWPKLAFFAGGIPLAATILLVANFHPNDGNFQEFAFKSLIIGLICSSAFGFAFVRRVGRAVICLIDRCSRSVRKSTYENPNLFRSF